MSNTHISALQKHDLLLSAVYDERYQRLAISFVDGLFMAVPIVKITALAQIPESELDQIEVTTDGRTMLWARHGVAISVRDLFDAVQPRSLIAEAA